MTQPTFTYTITDDAERLLSPEGRARAAALIAAKRRAEAQAPALLDAYRTAMFHALMRMTDAHAQSTEEAA